MAPTSLRQNFNWRRWRVLALIVVAGLLLVYGLVRVGSVFDVFADRYEIVALVPSALGLREGAPVTLAGQRIGQVSEIDFIPVERKVGANNLRIVLAISEDVREQIRSDSRAFLRTMGLLGDKFVDIAPGTSGAAILAAGDTIPTGKTVDLDEFMMQASSALDRATGIVTNLQDLTGGLTRGEGTLGMMLTDEQLYLNTVATTGQLRATIAEINRADGTFGRLIRDPTIYNRMHAAVSRVDSLGMLVLHSNGSMAQLLRSDSAYRRVMGTLTTADSAVTNLAGMVRSMTSGNGAIQKMMTDPQLYDEFLKAVIDAQTLINDIRLNPAKYKPIIRVDIF
jgi:phospholipid/cholesterol/gamma-HCH transport system substrate-binding protein